MESSDATPCKGYAEPVWKARLKTHTRRCTLSQGWGAKRARFVLQRYPASTECSLLLLTEAFGSLQHPSLVSAPLFLHHRALLQTLPTDACNVFLKKRPGTCSSSVGALPRANDSCRSSRSTAIRASERLALHGLQEVAERTHDFARSIPGLAWVHFLTVKNGVLLSQAAPPAAHRKHSCYAKITMKATTWAFLEKTKSKTQWPSNSRTGSWSCSVRCNPTSCTSPIWGQGLCWALSCSF